MDAREMAGFLSDRGHAVENQEGGIPRWANRGPLVRTRRRWS